MESKLLSKHVNKVFEVLPVNDEMRKQYLAAAHENSHKIGWDSVAKGYIF